MKNAKTPRLPLAVALALSAALLALASDIAAAQEVGSARGGAMKLLQRDRPAQVQPAEADVQIMSCPKCQDEWTTRPADLTRGAGARALLTGAPATERVSRHLCEGCETTLEVAGHGKAKHQVVKHTCTTCGAENGACCSQAAKP